MADSDSESSDSESSSSLPPVEELQVGDRVVVVDVGRLSWLVGYAGDDEPDAFWDDRRAMVEAGADVDPSSAVGLANFRNVCWQRLRAWHAREQLVPNSQTALFTVKLFDDAKGAAVAEIANKCFGSSALFSSIVLVPQEHLQVYAAGLTTVLIVNIGFEITTCTHNRTHPIIT
jgi:hypothetical protein